MRFVVKNLSQNAISLSDLHGLTLSPGQSVDLLSTCTLQEIQRSSSLSIAKSMGIVLIIDETTSNVAQQNITVVQDGLSEDVLKKVLDEQLGQIRQMLASNIIVSGGNIETKADTESVSEDVLVKIHQKTIDRATKDVKSSISTDNTEVKKENLSNNIDELDSLF